MSKMLKNCLQCNKEYLSNHFAERSKYCSRKCLSILAKKKKIEEQKAKTKIRQSMKVKKKRERAYQETLAANKAIAYLDLGDGTHQFGENMLTLKNYKEPLKQIPKEIGFGWYGTLAADVKTGKIQCHICGETRDSLPGHIQNVHKLPVRDYREKFGLAYTTALVSENQRMLLKQKTLDWIKTMTPEEKEQLQQRNSRLGRENRYRSKGTLGLKKTLEQMNKEGGCPDQTLQAIIDVKNELGHVPSKKDFIDVKKSQRYVHLAYKHFGSWKKAIEMCKFAEADFLERKQNGGKRNYQDEELLEYLRIYAQEYQQIPTTTDWKRDLLPNQNTYVNHFGSIEAARQLAGVYQIVEVSKSMLQRSKHYREAYRKIKQAESL